MYLIQWLSKSGALAIRAAKKPASSAVGILSLPPAEQCFMEMSIEY